MASLQVLFFLIVFRSIIMSLNQRAIYRPFLIFPFVYNLPFVLGLLNFSLGMVLWMISILFLVKLPVYNSFRKHAWIYWFFLAFFCYLSSLLSFAFMAAFSFIFITSQKEPQSRKLLFKHWMVAVTPILLLLLYYCWTQPLQFTFEVSVSERLYSWLSCESIVTFQELERLAAWPVGVVMTGLLLFAAYKVFSPQNAEPERLLWQRLLTVTAIFCALLFFLFPDRINGSDTLLVKFQLYGCLCLLMVIATIKLRKVYMIPLGILFLGVSVVRLRQQVQSWNTLRIEAAEYLEIRNEIPDKTRVLNLNFSTNKFHKNFGFLWNANQDIDLITDKRKASEADYIYVWKIDNDQLVYDQLSEAGTLVFSSSQANGKLFKLKKQALPK
jgi:hypothetical protein